MALHLCRKYPNTIFWDSLLIKMPLICCCSSYGEPTGNALKSMHSAHTSHLTILNLIWINRSTNGVLKVLTFCMWNSAHLGIRSWFRRWVLSRKECGEWKPEPHQTSAPKISYIKRRSISAAPFVANAERRFPLFEKKGRGLWLIRMEVSQRLGIGICPPGKAARLFGKPAERVRLTLESTNRPRLTLNA